VGYLLILITLLSDGAKARGGVSSLGVNRISTARRCRPGPKRTSFVPVEGRPPDQ
jgi:hypothetical protein